jgi:hypothetical protein
MYLICGNSIKYIKFVHNIRIGLVARICRSHISAGKARVQFPDSEISSFCFFFGVWVESASLTSRWDTCPTSPFAFSRHQHVFFLLILE